MHAMSDPAAQYLHRPGVREKLLAAPRSKKRFLLISQDDYQIEDDQP